MGNCGSSREEKEDIDVEKIFCGSYFLRKPLKKKKKKKAYTALVICPLRITKPV